ncbi:MAG: 2-succinyl-6-hydroxy-2,4-cyclohexadiene-1-carboxylate synthase [Burkholderiaceae bacterium]|nr:2-succinyl-6-hydroxy-2,4-cyclohexadiene-1-carboxylate synthase [Burkholderiaceae bacterium]
MTTTAYIARRSAHSRFIAVRGLRYHVNLWGDLAAVSRERPLLVWMHGWMDVGASLQFVVDALREARPIAAPDWRGFGRTAAPPLTDSYWFPDYLGDLDALLDALSPSLAVDLAGHSMGGNVVMTYASARPERIRRLVNMEGFGLPESPPEQAPERLRRWLDELKTAQRLKPYDSLDAVAARLTKNNPRLAPERALWLAAHWAERRDDGLWHLLGDPAHKRMNPVPYRKDEALAGWRRIAAPTLWIEGDETDPDRWWGHRYPRSEFDARIALVPDLRRVRLAACGHMLHFDQPQALAEAIESFLGAP